MTSCRIRRRGRRSLCIATTLPASARPAPPATHVAWYSCALAAPPESWPRSGASRRCRAPRAGTPPRLPSAAHQFGYHPSVHADVTDDQNRTSIRNSSAARAPCFSQIEACALYGVFLARGACPVRADIVCLVPTSEQNPPIPRNLGTIREPEPCSAQSRIARQTPQSSLLCPRDQGVFSPQLCQESAMIPRHGRHCPQSDLGLRHF